MDNSTVLRLLRNPSINGTHTDAGILLLPTDPPRLQVALRYLDAGLSVIPLCPHDHAGWLPSQHLPGCKNPGKRPVVRWGKYQERLPTVGEVRGWWERNPAFNVGVVTGRVSGLVVIDVDGPECEELLARRAGGTVTPTMRFSTSTGRYHLCYRWPWDRPATSHQFKAGSRTLSILADGRETVLPPSVHKSGAVYGWLDVDSDNAVSLADAPEWLQALCSPVTRPPRVMSARRPAGVASGGQRSGVLAKVERWLARCPAAVSGRGGHDQTFKVCCGLVHGYGLNRETAWDFLVNEYNPRCEPPWSDDELAHKLDEAITKGSYPRKLGQPALTSTSPPARVGDAHPVPPILGTSAPKLLRPEVPKAIEPWLFVVPSTGRDSDEAKRARPQPPLPPTAAEVQPEDVDYLWNGYLPTGVVVLLEGWPKKGKSILTRAVAAAVTTGKPPPGGGSRRACEVMWFTSEERLARDVKPGLAAAGADLGLVRFPTRHPTSGEWVEWRFPRDEEKLLALVRRTGAALVVTDALVDFFDLGLNDNNQQDARAVLLSLARVAQATGCTVLALRHLRKGKSGSAGEQGIGSIGIAAVARQVLRVDSVQGSKRKRTLSVVSCAFGEEAPTLTFEIVDAGGVGMVQWGKRVATDAEELAGDQGDAGEQDARADANRLLRTRLKDGWVRVNDLLREAKGASISEKTLRREKAALGVQSRQRRDGEERFWEWGPPPEGWTGKA